ncbi:P-loop containing nucleoside triphosphate hydrolase protein, partial [Exidia glandulosa HHB12029]
GRANVGKSSLINRLVMRNDLARSGKRPGLTQELNFFGIGKPPKVFLVDAPGYGRRGRPEWGALVDSYLDMPNNHLRRVFILLNFEHGLVGSWDPQMLELLHQRVHNAHGVGFAFQAVFTKAEGPDARAGSPRAKELLQQIHQIAPTCLPPVFTSAHLGTGIDDLQLAIGEACGLAEKAAYREEMARGALDDNEIEYHHVAPRSPSTRTQRQ